jgi:hypothetical protein
MFDRTGESLRHIDRIFGWISFEDNISTKGNNYDLLRLEFASKYTSYLRHK